MMRYLNDALQQFHGGAINPYRLPSFHVPKTYAKLVDTLIKVINLLKVSNPDPRILKPCELLTFIHS
ncbi:hypothetical protein AK812_SmicGene7801 [Symbiodinium microadriaticum]|uniref:Uncharacterized protein n=1 Tax=Symbiodinium microadriaticum TaxID=2951 RepID=A0A1Q9EMU7_SYMMI|nr:hypothetical protein AK812_SmicGene7801 [Symbiodinium microadriaticum]